MKINFDALSDLFDTPLLLYLGIFNDDIISKFDFDFRVQLQMLTFRAFGVFFGSIVTC